MTNDELEQLFYRQTLLIQDRTINGRSYSDYMFKECLSLKIRLIFAGLMETAYIIAPKEGKHDVWGLY